MRRFRIHLSTLVILSFAAGGIIYLNVRHREVDSSQDLWFDDEANDRNDRYFGWPIQEVKPEYWDKTQQYEYPHQKTNFYLNMAKNVLAGLAILALVAAGAEYLSRSTGRGRGSSR